MLRSSLAVKILGGALLLGALAGCGGGSSSSRPTTPTSTNSIVFVSTRDGAPELYRMNSDGTGQTRLTTGLRDADNPSQTRDGRIVFQSNRDGNLEIYRVNADGSNLVRLTNDAVTATVSDSQPVFSPDGNTIAWTSERGGKRNIWLMDATGANQRQFTSAAIGISSAAWAPDSARLGYFFDTGTGARDSILNLQIKNVSTGQTTYTATTPTSSPEHLRFNSDASKAIYAAGPLGTRSLEIYDLASNTRSGGPKAPSSSLGLNRAPDFGPNGQLIVWDAINGVSSSSGPAQIFRAGADGTAITALTTQGSNFSPDF